MDKNYSVDDILLDIKSKKMRRKEEDGERPPPAAGSEETFPAGSRSGKSGVSFVSPDSSAGQESAVDQVLRELRQPKPENIPPAPPEPKAPQPKEPAFEFVKSEPADAPPVDTLPLHTPPDQPAAAFTPIPNHPGSIEDLKKPESGRNPLSFGGHVRSLTDRAKIRREKNAAAQKKPHQDTAVIDFANFRTPGAKGERGSDLQETQAIPRLGPSRELDLGEIRNMDFGESEEAYDTPQHEYDYDEDDYEDSGDGYRSVIDFSEYNSIEDRRNVAIDIARTKLWLVLRTFVTFLLTVCLVYLVLCGRFMLPMPEMLAPEVDLRMYLLAITALTVGVILVGSSAMGGGLISFFKFRSNSDSLVALAMLGAVGQCVFALRRPELVDYTALTFYSALAATSMLFNSLGKLSMVSRIQANFKIISSDKPKKAVIIANDESFTREYLKGATRKPCVAFSAKCEFFTDFLALSYSDKYDVGINKAVAPVCLLGAGVVGALTYILTQNSMTALSAVVGILCIAATFSATFIENVPLGKLTRKLAPKGGMVSGNKAVEDFCDISAFVLDEKDLFPPGYAKVHGIKAYAHGRVDEAILDAASIAYAMNSMLSGVFLQMIGGNKKLLRKVDNAYFENERGITAWIDGRRVMLGNRKLMQSHGINLPDPGYEKKYEGGEPLFLSSAGELTAQLIIGYKVDEELALELDRLGAMGKLLIVRTIDANLTSGKIWEMYGYPEELVQIMPAYQHDQYQKMAAPRSSELAEVAYTGRASAMAGCLLACVSARASILSATVIQLIQIALGYGLIALMAFLGSMDTLTILLLGGYQLFWFVVIWLVQRLKAA